MHGTSLLAQLYPYFKGSQEDVATTSLQYIVSSDEVLNRAFTDILMEKLSVKSEGVYQYRCQITGKSDEKERPDISGFDANGDEKILCESKFYAALTVNQPNTYLKRLIDENGLGLVFICPEPRKNSLWNEVTKRTKSKYETVEITGECIEINKIRMSIITWREILDRLSDVALKNNIDQMDIKELRGYCDKLDSDAFIPFDEMDFGIENGIKQRRHTRLLDEVVTSLKNDKTLKVSTEKLKATPQLTGYTRYFRMKDFCVSLVFDTTKWINPHSFITPYWVRFSKSDGKHWILDDKCNKAMMKIAHSQKDGEYLALVAPCYVPLDDIVDSIKKQIIDYLKVFESVEEN